MSSRGGLSGLGVAVVAAGAYVMYAAVRDVPLLDGARQLIRGQTPTPRQHPAGGSSAGSSWLAQIAANPGGSAGGSAGTAGLGGAAGGSESAALGDRLANAASRYLGRPYAWGKSFLAGGGGDCSGLVMRAHADVGITDCPRTSAAIAVWRKLRKVPRADVRPGDVLWWPGHVAMAVSGATMIEAPTFGIPVRIVGIRAGALCQRYAG